MGHRYRAQVAVRDWSRATEFFLQILEEDSGVKWLAIPSVNTRRTPLEVELVRRVCSHGNDLEPAIDRVKAELPDHRRSVHAGQTHVQKQHVGLAAAAQAVKRS